VVNFLALWDLIWIFRLEAWRRVCGGQVRRWFQSLAQLEALCSLAAYAYARPRHAFPRVGGPLRYEARGLGHPLLDRPVVNDVSLPGPRSALLVTGSNMSGKTTLLRAMGANAVLALAGAPVCASSLELSVLQVLTGMRVKDSLERGISYFYAEVSRLRVLLDAASERRGEVMFLLDEILLGTNTVERQIASREVLALLLRTGAIGAVSTHDLSLASLANSPELAVRNVHFRDTLRDGQMSFDYRLREGVVDTTNALRVLRQAGIPVSE
jgi:DNA mismatch repair ATPase MutS